MTACDDKLLLIHALVDGELDIANAAALETHLAGCEGCRAELAMAKAIRARFAAQDLAWHAPAGLADRISRSLGEAAAAPQSPVALSASRPPARRPNRMRAWLGGLTGLAAGLVLGLALPGLMERDAQDELVASHVRSLLADHLTDVGTSDQHQVKPWFNGRINFAPSAPELKDEGFPLAGGRLDYVGGKVVAAIVYHRRLHPINLFIRPAGRLALPVAISSQEEGYNLIRWTKGGLEYWAISDLNAKELGEFQQLFVKKLT